MKGLTAILIWMGEHSISIVTGCVIVVLLLLLIRMISKKNTNTKDKYSVTGYDKLALEELNHREDEVTILIRRSDFMPVYVVGDLEGILDVSFQKIQEDVMLIFQSVKDDSKRDKIKTRYQNWDGNEPMEEDICQKNGQWIRMSVQRVHDRGYDLLSFYLATKFHEQVKQYEERIIELEEESRSKTTFLSRMSHEIRTPMNGIMGMLSLAENQLPKEHPAMQYLEKTNTLSDHLLSLINDILDMSRIEAGKVELENQPFSLRKLGRRVYDMFARDLEARGIYFAVNFEEVTVDYVIGDELRISQVILNFLSNAVKFTEKGEVTVTFRQMMLKDGIVDLMICVHDTGKGMSTEFINRIFRPFEQEENSSQKYGGTGLGMAITDHIVKLMQGEIIVKSEEGKGSDFTVFVRFPVAEEHEIPIEEQTMEPEGEVVENAFKGRKILMAEDNEINAMIACEILENMGAMVDLAVNGEEAVENFISHPEEYYDFILMDVQMPVMNGREAAQVIRKLDRADAAQIPIFALSADAFVEDERLSMESGMNGHFAKPINFEELQKKIGIFLNKEGK